MSTWTELKRHASKSYRLADERDHSFKVVFKYPGGRLQAVIVSHYEAMGRVWVDFSSACCRIDRMDPREALEQGFNLAVGAICLDGDVYVVRHTVLLDELAADDLQIHMHSVARAADQIEQSLERSEPAQASMPGLANELP
ncbi:MAG: hypothetical protein OES69_00280 [Myxococcales bacterium]|nr:hypothetical protein [Myxococcales bacterium]MDH3842345.1 hypothetical protein [Myxococcales bacterium]